MVKSSYASALICAILLVLGTQCIFPTPKLQYFQDKYVELANEKACFDFSIKTSAKVTEYIDNVERGYFQKVVKRIQKRNQCVESLNKINALEIIVKHNETIKKQGYRIQALEKSVIIEVSTYAGYVYALETFAQIFSKGYKYQLGIVEDEPLVQHRGIMIDSVRHFLSVNIIKKLIESMPLSKLNILHWHLADDEAFTMELSGHPELAKGGKYSDETFYSLSQIKDVISFASQHAVSVVPEFDSPGHIRSWGLSEPWKTKNITILCPKGEGYNHQFDLSMNDTYKLVQEVIREVDDVFRSAPYLHLGGDEVFGSCWDRRPAIKTFMTLKNIKNYGELQMYWRYEIKQALPQGRKTVYWLNTAENVTTGPEDILQYWGSQVMTAEITKNSQSKIILSPLDFLYLNMGKGNIWQNASSGPFRTWREIYTNFTVFPQGVDKSRILGAEVCLWGEVSNEDTLENNIWMRASSFAQKVWSEKVKPLNEIVTELVDLQHTLRGMGVQPSPIVSEFCEQNTDKCFASRKQYKVIEE